MISASSSGWAAAAQPRRRGGGRLVHGQRPADPGRGRLQRAQHVVGLDGGRLPGDLGGHERVAVPVGAHPAAEAQVRGDGRGLVPSQRPVQLPVHRGYHPEQRLVERGHDRPDLVDRVHGLDPELRGPPQQVDVLAQPAAGLGALGCPGPLVVGNAKQLADPAQHRHYRPAAGLGGVRGQHQVHAQFVEQLEQLSVPGVAAQLGHGGGQRLADRLAAGVALAQLPDALVFLGQVGQVEVHGEGARHLLGPVQAPGGDQGRDRVPGRVILAPFLVAGLDHGAAQPLHVG